MFSHNNNVALPFFIFFILNLCYIYKMYYLVPLLLFKQGELESAIYIYMYTLNCLASSAAALVTQCAGYGFPSISVPSCFCVVER